MSSCNCTYGLPPSYTVVQCHFCNSSVQDTIQTQKRIWQQVRVPGSLYTMNKAAITAASGLLRSDSFVNWNQRSDQAVAHVQTAMHPTHGNSLRSSLTSHKPGSGAPGGTGVDIKHDSYARFLNKRKGQVLRTQQPQETMPLQGNKTQMYGLLSNTDNCCTGGVAF